MARLRTVVISILTFAAAVVFMTTAVRALLFAPPDPSLPAPQEAAETQDPASFPKRLRIPKLNVDTKVQHVGVTAQGNMGVPNNYTDVGWYQYGVSPGNRGSAVMAGHVDNGLALPGVFKRLHELEVGDDVFVETEEGVELHFVVSSKRSYPYAEAPTEAIFNPTGSARLNLITCEGEWLAENRTYDQRLVVFTRLVND